jgi:hypothetical protein
MIIEWIAKSALILSAMCIDNLFWISASPEYPQFKKGEVIKVGEKTYYGRYDYIIRYRIFTVLTHWRDLVPAIIVGGIWSLW